MEEHTKPVAGHEQAMAPEQVSPMAEVPQKRHFVAWIVVLLVGVALIAIAGYYILSSGREVAPEVADDTNEVMTQDTTGGSLDTNVTDNPFEDVQANPVEEGADNPFEDADYNPFN